jgi:hypothetical protein
MFLAQSFRVWNARVWNAMGLERFRKEVSWPAIEPLDCTICGMKIIKPLQSLWMKSLLAA